MYISMLFLDYVWDFIKCYFYSIILIFYNLYNYMHIIYVAAEL